MNQSVAPGQITSLEDYYRLRQQRLDRDEEKPYAAIFLLSDVSTLFWQEHGIDWATRIRCELPTRALRYDGSEAKVYASYIGCANGDKPEFYEMFVMAMAQIGVTLCMHIHADPTRRQRRHLEQSDVILLGGGDVRKGWENLDNTFLGESIKWRYYSGAVIIGIAEGAALLGHKIFYRMKGVESWVITKSLNLMNVCVSCNDIDDVENLGMVKQAGPGTVMLGLPKMAAVIYNTDGAYEPVRKAVTEIHYNYENSEPHAHYVFPPEKGEGILVHVEVYEKRKAKARREAAERPHVPSSSAVTTQDDTGGTTDEEEGSDSGGGSLDTAKAEGLRKAGNEAFTTGDYAAALQLYQQAQLSHKDSPLLWTNIAATLLKQKKLDECIEAATQALVVSKGKAVKAWYRRAEAYRAQGLEHEASADGEEAMTLMPGDPDIASLCKAHPYQWTPPEEDTEEEVPLLLQRPYTRLRPQGLRECLRRLSVRRELPCEDIVTIDLTGNAIRDTGVRALCYTTGLFVHLESLALARNNITDDVMECLCENLKECSRLHSLDLSYNSLSFRGIRPIATLLRTPNITMETVKLQGNMVTSDAIIRLMAVGIGHTTLREIDVRGVKVSRSVQAEVEAACKYERCLIRVGALLGDEEDDLPPKGAKKVMPY